MSLDDTPAQATPDVSTPSPSPTPEAAPAAVEPSAPESSVEDDLSKVWSKHNPNRDKESGRFASREKPTDETAEVEAPAAEIAEPEAEAPNSPAVEAPRAWSAEDRELWGKLPPEAQRTVAKYQSELHEIKSISGRLASEYKPIRETFGQHAEYLGHIGMQPAQWLSNALQISRALDTGQAPAVIKHLADQYGVDLGQLYDPLAPPPNQEVAELRREIAALRGQRQTEHESRAASDQAAQLGAFQSIVNEFKSKHPDASEFEDDIAAEIQALRITEPDLDHAAVLAKAYERAAWANPAARAKRVEAQLAERLKTQEQARVAAAKEAATKAKAAASVNVSGSPSSVETGEIDDDLRAIWRKRNVA